MSNRLSSKDIIILTTVNAAWFIGSGIAYVLKMPPIMVSVFLGTGIASLVYHLLGGIQGAKLYVGILKVSGPAALLLGSTFFINSYLEKQTTYDLSTIFTPTAGTWFALDKRKGIPIQVKIKGTKGVIKEPAEDIFANNPLNVFQIGNTFRVVTEAEPNFILGNLSVEDLQKLNLFNSIEKQLIDFIVTERLPPNTPNIDLDPLPLELSTKNYGGEYSRYTLMDESGKTLHDGAIYRRQAEIVGVQDRYYLVAVTEVNHEAKEDRNKYAKFAIGEIVISIEPKHAIIGRE